MTSSPRVSELQLALDLARAELLRAFVREASLAENVRSETASMIAEDATQVWLTLCGLASGRERVRVALECSRGDVIAKILLHGHSQFSNVAASLAGNIRSGASIACREHGIDGWQVILHRSLNDTCEPPPIDAEEPASATVTPIGPQDFSIDAPKESDTTAIARCFLEVYGHHYVHSEVFSPHRYWGKVETGELIPVVARDTKGDVIGHLALERDLSSFVAERGEAVVLSAYRGHHLLERMTERLSDEALKHGLHGIYAEPVTIHTFSQRNDERAGMPVCAVLLGVNPENFRPKNLPCPTAGQRQSYLRVFRFLRQAEAREINIHPAYKEIVLKIYTLLGVTASVASPGIAASKESRTGVTVNNRGYGVIHFEQIGLEAAIELKQAMSDVRALGASSVQLSALVGDPGLPLLTDAARDLGFFFCGLGPAFAEGADTFLLQSLSEPLDIGKLQLFTDFAKELVAFVELDRANTQKRL